MPRYVALLRGVSPLNCSMPVLKACLEEAGFTGVKTVLTSGNVAFGTPRSASLPTLQKRVEKALLDGPGYRFPTFVRSTAHLRKLLDGDPFAGFRLPSDAKRLVIFLREPLADGAIDLPIGRDGGSLLKLAGGQAFAYYMPGPKASGFMALLERTLGKDLTTRTLDTVVRCAKA